MAITQQYLDLLRAELETKLAGATVDQVKTATAISAYGERFNGIEARFSVDVDRRFGWQTFLTSAVGVLVLFGDVIRPLIGLG